MANFTNYNYTENGRVYPFDDVFVVKSMFASELWTWGINTDGQLGVNDIIRRSTPVQEFTSSTNWRRVSSGEYHTAAIKTDGTLWLWGRNSSGQLGVNDNIRRSTPVQEFTSSTNWKQVSGGASFTAAIKTDGTLWLWGDGAYGQLGINISGFSVGRSTPVQEFTSSTNWKQVSLGDLHTAAIKTDGTLWLWGDGGWGQLGVNDRVDRSTPVQEFTSSTNWKQVSMGDNHSAAIKTDGTLWSWGLNNHGPLGVNDLVTRSTPVQEFTSSTNWKQVSAGRFFSAAIKTDGTLWSWGFDNYGQMGVNDDNITRSIPVQEFTSSTNWKQVAGGYNQTISIKTDGTLWGWGANFNGSLGVNDNISRSTPVQEFTSSTNWKQVFSESGQTLAIKTSEYPILY